MRLDRLLIWLGIKLWILLANLLHPTKMIPGPLTEDFFSAGRSFCSEHAHDISVPCFVSRLLMAVNFVGRLVNQSGFFECEFEISDLSLRPLSEPCEKLEMIGFRFQIIMNSVPEIINTFQTCFFVAVLGVRLCYHGNIEKRSHDFTTLGLTGFCPVNE